LEDLGKVYPGGGTAQCFSPTPHRSHQGSIYRLTRALGRRGKNLGACARGYPLAKTADALKAIADRKVMGKVILRP